MTTRAFAAMGTTARVTVLGGSEGILDDAVAAVRHAERRWSRFLPDSELCRLNAAAGHPVLLPRDTYELVAAAVRCWELTAGRFDPTVLRAVVAAGYDRTFVEASKRAGLTAPAPGCAGIELDDVIGAVRLPTGVGVDLGGIAKGHTADLVAELVLDGGAEGVLVDLGGDVRVAGASPDGSAWRVAIADPLDDGRDVAVVRLTDGAVATSSTRRRRWRDGATDLHHLIDPRSGRPVATSLASVTVVAASAAWAEVTAKAALVADVDAADVVRAAGVTGLAVHDDGRIDRFEGLEVFA